ncbi:3-deoxy-manno-octulosonate cytidylyltransferase, partial [Algiphilus sp.]|uniref:3-deoxy-manno-octulosonate cytidylyltransferase n=1 Tax=Algiphilus sp. TaxID=1872431 RepID=UPI003C3F8998
MDKHLLDILVCPVTGARLVWRENDQELWSRAARLAYPVRDGIPVMLEERHRARRDRRLSVPVDAAFDVVIPARLGSTRLPGKVLADIHGRPLIAHVHDRAMEAGARSVVIATDSERVVEACRAFGGDVQLTSPMHHSGTDRVHEVATIRGWPDDRLVVNIQGDEPLMPPSVVAACAARLEGDPDADITTCAHRIDNGEDFANPNVVKVVCDARGRALYFSR